MKIIFYSPAFATCGGLERVWSDRMNALSQAGGYEVLLVTTDQGGRPCPYPLADGVRHVDLGIDMWRRYTAKGLARAVKGMQLERLLRRRLTALLAKERPDVIAIWQIYQAGPLLKCAGATPVIFESHNIMAKVLPEGPASLKERLKTGRWRRNAAKVSTIVTLTPEDAADWKTVNPSTVCIPNSVSLQQAGRRATGLDKRVIFAGRNEQQKGFGYLMEAWQKVAPSHPDWELHIYGEGMTAADQQAAIPQGLRIHLHENTTEIMQRYCESSLLALTSEYEPFGLVIPEAMSCGLPVVAFDCDHGPRNIITNGSDGLLVSCYDTGEFARKLAMLMDNPELRIEMGRRAQAATARFDIGRIMPRWTDLYRKLSTP